MPDFQGMSFEEQKAWFQNWLAESQRVMADHTPIDPNRLSHNPITGQLNPGWAQSPRGGLGHPGPIIQLPPDNLGTPGYMAPESLPPDMQRQANAYRLHLGQQQIPGTAQASGPAVPWWAPKPKPTAPTWSLPAGGVAPAGGGGLVIHPPGPPVAPGGGLSPSEARMMDMMRRFFPDQFPKPSPPPGVPLDPDSYQNSRVDLARLQNPGFQNRPPTMPALPQPPLGPQTPTQPPSQPPLGGLRNRAFPFLAGGANLANRVNNALPFAGLIAEGVQGLGVPFAGGIMDAINNPIAGPTYDASGNVITNPQANYDPNQDPFAAPDDLAWDEPRVPGVVANNWGQSRYPAAPGFATPQPMWRPSSRTGPRDEGINANPLLQQLGGGGGSLTAGPDLMDPATWGHTPGSQDVATLDNGLGQTPSPTQSPVWTSYWRINPDGTNTRISDMDTGGYDNNYFAIIEDQFNTDTVNPDGTPRTPGQGPIYVPQSSPMPVAPIGDPDGSQIAPEPPAGWQPGGGTVSGSQIYNDQTGTASGGNNLGGPAGSQLYNDQTGTASGGNNLGGPSGGALVNPDGTIDWNTNDDPGSAFDVAYDDPGGTTSSMPLVNPDGTWDSNFDDSPGGVSSMPLDQGADTDLNFDDSPGTTQGMPDATNPDLNFDDTPEGMSGEDDDSETNPLLSALGIKTSLKPKLSAVPQTFYTPPPPPVDPDP
jgi:hypothetical protein